MTHPLDALFPSNDRIAPGAAGDAAPRSPGDMVTIARRFNPLEAELLRGRLAADGIPAVLGDSHTVQTDTLLTAALGGVRIRVPTAYERQALRAIADIDRGAFALDESSDVGEAPDADLDPQPSLLAAARDAAAPRLVAGAVGVLVFVAVLVGLAR